MDRSFLYGIIVLLGITDAVIYIQKTEPNLFGNFFSGANPEGWRKDPGWSQDPGKKDEKKEQKKDEEKKGDIKKDEKKDDKLDENKSPDQQEQGRRRHFRLFRSN